MYESIGEIAERNAAITTRRCLADTAQASTPSVRIGQQLREREVALATNEARANPSDPSSRDSFKKPQSGATNQRKSLTRSEAVK